MYLFVLHNEVRNVGKMVKEETLPKGFVSEYISLDRKSYNAIKQRVYRRLSKCSDRSIGVLTHWSTFCSVFKILLSGFLLILTLFTILIAPQPTT